ncbi:MAG: insulinase family protein [Clostridia bacterium]|nr:insulinase family protein [Clostridia bacterium]
MKLELGAKIGGFKVERIRESAELGGRFIEMRHTGCGAELIYMDNGDSNKLFCVSFKTLPDDSTGVFHILEHSVLCGSKKYPVKEPFLDLMKSSMNTFLNAMTFPDKTMYPVSSRNERDFLNLTSVYLDAVFAPLCIEDPNAFRQEGWHLETDENGAPLFNGVVYNEMKGAASSYESVLYNGMNELLYPDNCYKFISGGDPVVIPELTYEKYCELYHQYYHPSNARFFLDGSVPLEKTVELIEEYIGSAEMCDATHPIPMQIPTVGRKTLPYEIGADEDEANKTMLSFGRIVCPFIEKRTVMMLEVLAKLLAETNESPLKRAILDNKLGEDVSVSVAEQQQQINFSFDVINTEANNEAEIVAVVKKTIADLLKNGVDKDLLTAHINKYAYMLKDIPEPAGLFYRCLGSLNSSLYGGDPLLYLENDADIKALRKSAENGEFDALLKELFDFDKLSVLTVVPSKTYGEEQRAAEKARAEAMYAPLTEAERADLAAMNERLVRWQQTPDSKESVATLPVLPLSEVSEDPMDIPTRFYDENGAHIIEHRITANGIAHFMLYFTATDLEKAELAPAKLMTKLLGKLPTKRHTVAELGVLINTYIGRYGFEITTAALDKDSCTPYITAKFSALEENAEKAIGIITEILLETDFSDGSRIREIVQQTNEETKQFAINMSHALGICAVSSHYCAAGVVDDETKGVGYRAYIKALAAEQGENAALCERFTAIASRSFARSRLILSITSSAPVDLDALISALPEGSPVRPTVDYRGDLPKKLGIRIPSQVSSAVKGIYAGEITGTRRVAASLITLNYLWGKVRVQNGAYGCGFRANPNGTVTNHSYLDPSPAKALEAYDSEADFINEFAKSDEPVEKYIISTIGMLEPLMTPGELGAYADREYLSGRTPEVQAKLRREVLSTTKEKLFALSELFDKMRDEGAVCVVGNDAALSSIDGLTVIDA